MRHFFQFGADLRALLCLASALVAELGDAGDLLADVFRNVALFFRRRGHLLAHAGDARYRLADAVQSLLYSFDAGDAFSGNLFAFVGGQYRTSGAVAQGGDDLLDLLGRGLGA